MSVSIEYVDFLPACVKSYVTGNLCDVVPLCGTSRIGVPAKELVTFFCGSRKIGESLTVFNLLRFNCATAVGHEGDKVLTVVFFYRGILGGDFRWCFSTHDAADKIFYVISCLLYSITRGAEEHY